MTSLSASKPTKEVFMTIPHKCKASDLSSCGISNRFRNGYCNKHYLQYKRTGSIKSLTNRDERKAIFSDGVWKIPLGTGGMQGYALVDENFAHLDQYKWYLSCGYAVSKIKGKMKKMHRLIVGASPKEHVDHINRNKLDNRKHNLRQCTSSQNAANSGLKKNNTSGFKGVFLMKNKYYFAKIKVRREDIHLGFFKTPEAAAKAYDKAAIKYFGEYALTNKNIGLHNG